MNKIILGSIIAVVLSANTNIFSVKALDNNDVKNISNDKFVFENVKGNKNLIPVSNNTPNYIIGVSEDKGTIVKIDKVSDKSIIVINNVRGEELAYYNRYEKLNDSLIDLKVGDEIIIKYALGTPLKYNNFNALPLNHIEVLKKINIEDGKWREIKSLSDIDEEKVLLIRFNKDFNNENVTNDNIFVLNALGENVPVDIEVSYENKIIKIKPLEKYVNGQTYKLYIKNILCNVDEEFKGYKMNFIIKNGENLH